MKPRRRKRRGSVHKGLLLPLLLQLISPRYMNMKPQVEKWRNPAMKPQVAAFQSSVVAGADGAIPAWVADECNRALGQE